MFSLTLRLCMATGFEQKPGSPLCLVHPSFEQACGSHVAMSLAKLVGLAHGCLQLFIIVTQFRQHVERRDIFGIIVLDALQATDLPDRMQRSPANLAYTFGDVIGGGEYLITLFIQHQVIVAEVRS